METLQYLMTGFGVALSTTNLLVAAIGALVGTIVGMLPGLGPINGVAILMPLAFALKLPAETALILLAAVYMGCEFGGRISSILLNVPGDAGAIMTALDGYPMARQGMGGVALSISAWSSFIGSLIATVGIVMFAPLLARWALAFGPAEYFALMCFAFACITGLMGDAPMKAALAAVIGLSLACVGLDSNSGVYRFTGGDVHLSDGIQFIVLVIGLFSISEILLMLEQHHSTAGIIKATGRSMFNLKEMAHTWWSTIRSSVVGFVVGVLPGAGATIASAITYTMEKRLAGPDNRFGDGDIRGVAAPEAANNASAAGSFVPMLTLGVPGSGTTAVMMGALALYNITPGPALFTQNPTLVWGLIASFFVANVLLLIINIPLVGVFARMLQTPSWLLVPAILAVSAVGVYSVHATTFDLVLMSVFGVVGYLLRKQGVPMAPLILGFVLGDMMEQNLRRALSITDGDVGILV
ncbi:MAG TPA: tripartite tricarboxylate transporter permease, partial [Ottowia sp.]|nr:tripartite tricarboxylate transporter permease [Ottowia sp.]